MNKRQTRNRKAKRQNMLGRYVLSLLTLVLFSSAAIKLGALGTAIAKGDTPLTLGTTAEPEAPQTCTTDEETERLLAALQDRKALLDERESTIEHRMVALEAVDQRIQQKLDELEAAENALAATISVARTAASDDLNRLTALYENMKPKQAIPLFEAMDPEFAAGFLAQMKPASAAQIMAGLKPDIAYAISVILAGRNSEVPTH